MKITAISAVLAASCLVTACGGMQCRFDDIPKDAVYNDAVAQVCCDGTMRARETHVFAPNDALTAAEAARIGVTLCAIHNAQDAAFLKENPTDEQCLARLGEAALLLISDPTQKLTRLEFAELLWHILPQEELTPINEVEPYAIPDVNMKRESGKAVYALMRAGIFSPMGENNAMMPDEPVTRAQAAVLTVRACEPEKRISLNLKAQPFCPDVPEQPRMEDDYFADSAILGNSLVDGLRLYSELKSPHYFCGTGVTVVSAGETRSVTLPDGEQVTQLDALLDEQYDKVYIELGINEITLEQDYFISVYGELIDRIHDRMPDATVYLMSLLPVTQAKSAEGTFTTERIAARNQAIYQLAAEKHCYYLDLYANIQNEWGYMPEDISYDGVHMRPFGYILWEEAIRTHYVE